MQTGKVLVLILVCIILKTNRNTQYDTLNPIKEHYENIYKNCDLKYSTIRQKINCNYYKNIQKKKII